MGNFLLRIFLTTILKKLNGIAVHQFAICPLDCASPRLGEHRLSGLQGLRGTCHRRAPAPALSSLNSFNTVDQEPALRCTRSRPWRDGDEQGAPNLEGNR